MGGWSLLGLGACGRWWKMIWWLRRSSALESADRRSMEEHYTSSTVSLIYVKGVNKGDSSIREGCAHLYSNNHWPKRGRIRQAAPPRSVLFAGHEDAVIVSIQRVSTRQRCRSFAWPGPPSANSIHRARRTLSAMRPRLVHRVPRLSFFHHGRGGIFKNESEC